MAFLFMHIYISPAKCMYTIERYILNDYQVSHVFNYIFHLFPEVYAIVTNRSKSYYGFRLSHATRQRNIN